ncbi:hypothetical protein Droror1_Dr00007107 [Drosera rotundifolia]
MERLLIHSSHSSHLLLTHSKPYRPLPPPPRLAPVKSLKFGLYSLPCALQSTPRVLSSLSSRHGGFSTSSSFSNSRCSSSPHASSADSTIGWASDSGLVRHLSRKAVDAGKLILLTTLAMLLIHPFLTSPALARFPNAANVGNAAATSMGRRMLRTEILISAWTGFSAGCLHTLSGPDHLAALAPLSIGRTRMESAVVGALWGCGHDAGQVIFGLIFLLLQDRLHIEVIRTWGTRVVGLTLLVIGAIGLKEASEGPTPCVALENGECDVGANEVALEGPAIAKKKMGFATFATGIVHGLQPDALMMVVPALALPSRMAGAAFLCMFLVGTVVAMGGYTVFIGSCTEALKDRIPRITEKLTRAASLVAIGLGLAILISQFCGFSLY